MVSPVEIVNQALDAMAAQATVQGINPPIPGNSLAAQVASRNYQTQVNAIFRAAHWACLRQERPLTLIKARYGTPENPAGALPQPPQPWAYEYAYPSDCLKMRFIQPGIPLPAAGSAPPMTNVGLGYCYNVPSGLPFGPAIDIDANGNKYKCILTNVCNAVGIYTAQVDNPDLWDSMLVMCVINALAAFFVNPLSRNRALMQERTQIAVASIQAARVADGNEGTTSSDYIPDWMQVRDAGGGSFLLGPGSSGNGTGYGITFGGWDNWGGPDGSFY